MPPTIRPATIDDAPALLAMIHTLAAHHSDTALIDAGSLARDVFCTPPWVPVHIAHAPDPVGYVACLPRAQLAMGLRGLEMHHLFVAPEHRATGLGRALVRAAAIHAQTRGCDYLSVSTHPDNSAAQAFYTALGFERQNAHPPRFMHRLT